MPGLDFVDRSPRNYRTWLGLSVGSEIGLDRLASGSVALSVLEAPPVVYQVDFVSAAEVALAHFPAPRVAKMGLGATVPGPLQTGWTCPLALAPRSARCCRRSL